MNDPGLGRLNHTKEAVNPMIISGRSMEDVVMRVQGEFLEMPGLRLTPQQARRLWRLDERSCDEILAALVETGFLSRTRDGAFVRHDDYAGK